MALNNALLAEVEHESKATKKILERVPEKDFEWKPHPKSTSIGRLATHIAELTRFISVALTTDELDFATLNYVPYTAKSSAELMEIFEKNLSEAKKQLENASDERLMKKWKLRRGEQIFFDLPTTAGIRTLAMSHLIHHRGQLSVYLRLLDVAVPPIYGPTADEPV